MPLDHYGFRFCLFEGSEGVFTCVYCTEVLTHSHIPTGPLLAEFEDVLTPKALQSTLMWNLRV